MRFGDLSGQVSGSGPLLVLLHGNGEDHHLFDPIVPLLAPTHRVVALDSRAHGASPPGDGPLTIERMAEDLAGVLDALGAGEADLVGFSDGGNIALTFALSHPERVRSALVYGANLAPGGLRLLTRCQLVVALWALRVASLFHRRARARAQTWALMTVQPRIDPAGLAAVTAPVLVMAGQRDLVKDSHTRQIAAALPNGQLRIVPGAGHFLPVKDPARFAGFINDFLASQAI